MKRGEIWTVSADGYAGKPRPALIVQDDAFSSIPSVTICALTSNEADASLVRILVEPSEDNGLRQPSRLMVDKITTVPRAKLGLRLGRLSDGDLMRFNRSAIVFLGLASPAARAAR